MADYKGKRIVCANEREPKQDPLLRAMLKQPECDLLGSWLLLRG